MSKEARRPALLAGTLAGSLFWTRVAGRRLCHIDGRATDNRCQQRLAQLDVEGKGTVETIMALHQEMPLQGQLVSLHVVLLQRAMVKPIAEKEPVSSRPRAITWTQHLSE